MADGGEDGTSLFGVLDGHGRGARGMATARRRRCGGDRRRGASTGRRDGRARRDGRVAADGPRRPARPDGAAVAGPPAAAGGGRGRADLGTRGSNAETAGASFGPGRRRDPVASEDHKPDRPARPLARRRAAARRSIVAARLSRGGARDAPTDPGRVARGRLVSDADARAGPRRPLAAARLDGNRPCRAAWATSPTRPTGGSRSATRR